MSVNRRYPPGTATRQEQADKLYDRVSEALRDHRDTEASKEELRASLQQTDEAFDDLHTWIMAGNPLPDPWRRRFVPVPPE